MITRDEYMKDSKNLHRLYFGQFVIPATFFQVISNIGMERICNSKDPHLNDIPLHEWDKMAYVVKEHCSKMLKECGDFYSLATATCILKETARQIAEENAKK